MSKVLAILALYLGVASFANAKSSLDGRILNGKEAAVGQFPYLVSIVLGDLHWCGGSIISSQYVLSAAHCVGNWDASGKFILNDANRYTIRAGSNERLTGGVTIKVASFVAHEDYFDDIHDLSILRLATPLVFSNTIKAVTLDTQEVPAGTTLTIAGWGRVKTNGDLSNKLLYTTATVLSRQACYDEIVVDSADIFCLSRPLNNGACNGDSGGAAVLNDKLVGVASFVVGGGCGTEYPDGYTKVSTHLQWIKNHSNI